MRARHLRRGLRHPPGRGGRYAAIVVVLIIIEARRADPTQSSSCEKIEALGLDGPACQG
ncbi:hypothetical protein [Pseudonocardia acidicola]|uniref:Uncharacterized protein n=1 Tax=Pseudonocardia acidicola TaxID=2724939 RepID=A0ABX1S5K9_9PSEU|nr:hypothetical protein [Pseudonocardia acidicola]NMH96863.1 hypothetical protein [Pseudonocardia acidicola]